MRVRDRDAGVSTADTRSASHRDNGDFDISMVDAEALRRLGGEPHRDAVGIGDAVALTEGRSQGGRHPPFKARREQAASRAGNHCKSTPRLPGADVAFPKVSRCRGRRRKQGAVLMEIDGVTEPLGERSRQVDFDFDLSRMFAFIEELMPHADGVAGRSSSGKLFSRYDGGTYVGYSEKRAVVGYATLAQIHRHRRSRSGSAVLHDALLPRSHETHEDEEEQGDHRSLTRSTC